MTHARAPLALALLFTVAAAHADSKQAEMQKMMEAWQKYATPGPEHARLKALAGSYDAAVKMWMEPGAPPQESQGKAELKTILGDRYLEQDFTGSMMGQPFAGMGLIGYDNLKKKYFSSWMDTTSTGVYAGEGTADKDGVLTFNSAAVDPTTGKTRKARDVLRAEPDGSLLFESYAPPPRGGKEYKVLEIKYTKKK